MSKEQEHALRIAQCAQLAMLLEVSATPKPGNVDRTHDFEDTSFEHFLASAVGALPALVRASSSSFGVGALIRDAVAESMRWHRGGNTHFGTFLLFVPLCMAAGRHAELVFTPRLGSYLRSSASHIVRTTTVDDSLDFLEAFHMARVKVKDVDTLDINQEQTALEIQNRGITLFDLMQMSARYDLVAREWVCGFEESFASAKMITELRARHTLNDAVLVTFLHNLAKRPDTFIAAKQGDEVAMEVSQRACNIVRHLEARGLHDSLAMIEQFDNELVSAHINPGSTADIVGAGLLIALLEGMVV
ncbi:triphosphoribosyl-dephospho-CoA synthase [Methermicoccus shengliensis]|uniref:Triphosphoribosyl-dephospho-CoA synthase n=1 Tax=Methermicoccus shengliensis TaxID=660064 RepID=A0A832W0L8_9EURY|nr:triphosphoribosyl-dephospho-CoA synthase [Methermicoccus shengliensis]KUK04785.1 MAG: Putative triphosphoribosyl-dephospho-CoA synthase [Euryarchaeota archaeon 55_53]KUK29501.1 MAG: Putative triphosphoribosyl-dephospho-CoA synthase [Methanosarcinales archeaon 56_1174]MDI3487702.1 triphosphoribosyl-dephospho-CoA synthase [Methanosarcinales archaeon]MDN5295534.1 triphosphoribosyl-dephospho-CoA synthase [Methanosarcinales archaeon]HIH70295.1 hypothetical protein [Methermicoccus shengliensis]